MNPKIAHTYLLYNTCGIFRYLWEFSFAIKYWILGYAFIGFLAEFWDFAECRLQIHCGVSILIKQCWHKQGKLKFALLEICRVI